MFGVSAARVRVGVKVPLSAACGAPVVYSSGPMCTCNDEGRPLTPSVHRADTRRDVLKFNMSCC